MSPKINCLCRFSFIWEFIQFEIGSSRNWHLIYLIKTGQHHYLMRSNDEISVELRMEAILMLLISAVLLCYLSSSERKPETFRAT